MASNNGSIKLKYSTVSPEEILRQRAESLARSTREQERQEKKLMVLVLVLGSEKYGVELPYIWEVLPSRKVTLVPGMPPMVKGVINYRGQIVPLFDLLALIAGESGSGGYGGTCVVFGKENVDFAVPVDLVEPPIAVEPDSLKESVSRPGEHGHAYVTGFTESGVVVLNMGALLDDESLIIDMDAPV
jgi:purine-binding chemotaxis protein CheW